ncbi:TMV resistance protein N-like, partial [Trifolium medium]|nr:TMV resistance protein N-like [Trifolium medium]
MLSSPLKPQLIHDVFLNFRGEDVRTTFVSHLNAALTNAGINTYIDHQLRKGTDLGQELWRAIDGSHISIVVFSKRYTESGWCLNELKKIMKCHRTQGQVVVPVFYDVDPSVVRHQKGHFGEVLSATAEKVYFNYESEWKVNVVSDWRSALTQAANLSGWDVLNC